jgi:acyl-CoA hydrolase
MTQIVMPTHVNAGGTVAFGGMIMQWIDICGGVAAMRHARGSVVTASIDRLDFLSPVRLGEVVTLQAQVNFAARHSMEVGCRVETEDPRRPNGGRRYTTKAYLTFVAVGKDGKPRAVPAIEPESDDERRRFADAEKRYLERRASRQKALIVPRKRR